MKSFYKNISKRKFFGPLVAILLVGCALLAVGLFRARGASPELEYATIERGNLRQYVEGSGIVRSRQSAELEWKTSGTVGSVEVRAGQQVKAGETLISLEKNSLSPSVIVAQANLVTAEQALRELETSRTQQAQAMKSLDEARKAWEDAQNPLTAQAEKRNAVAAAQKELDEAERLLAITASPPSPEAISQANANRLLAENAYNQTLKDMERIQKRLKKPESAYMFFESRDLYQQILDGLEQKEIRDRRAYEKAQENYARLLEPVDPFDLAVAETNVIAAQAKLDDAQKQWERIQDGFSQGELAVLKAKLDDAEREWERLKDGPDANDLRAAVAQVAAVQAILNQVQISAPFSGVITRLDTLAGDQVNSGMVALRLDDLTYLYVDINVSEIDIDQVQVGQKAVLTFESIPARAASDENTESGGEPIAPSGYTGTVVDVALVGTQLEDTVQYFVGIEIDQADALIRPGVSADALVQVNEVQDVVKIPNRAVRYIGAQRFVFVAGVGQPQPVEVELGIISEDYSQLLSGNLQPGDRVVLDPSEWLLTGLEK